MSSRIVVCGAGFIGSHITRTLLTAGHNVQITSRQPKSLYERLKISAKGTKGDLSAVSADISDIDTLWPALDKAKLVVSLVGMMHGKPQDFERIQWKGAENVATVAKSNGAKLVHFSAIGADRGSSIHYARTKALGEEAAFSKCPDATVIRPSLVFGPEDDFFNRFSLMSRYMPFLPVFGGGNSKFQPVFVGDLARAVEIIAREDGALNLDGKIVEAGGPEVYTYRQLMEMVLRYNGRRRPIVSLPFAYGSLIGSISERLPHNLFTVTRAQVEQLKSDNVVRRELDGRFYSFKKLIEEHSSSGLKSLLEYTPPAHVL